MYDELPHDAFVADRLFFVIPNNECTIGRMNGSDFMIVDPRRINIVGVEMDTQEQIKSAAFKSVYDLPYVIAASKSRMFGTVFHQMGSSITEALDNLKETYQSKRYPMDVANLYLANLQEVHMGLVYEIQTSDLLKIQKRLETLDQKESEATDEDRIAISNISKCATVLCAYTIIPDYTDNELHWTFQDPMFIDREVFRRAPYYPISHRVKIL